MKKHYFLLANAVVLGLVGCGGGSGGNTTGTATPPPTTTPTTPTTPAPTTPASSTAPTTTPSTPNTTPPPVTNVDLVTQNEASVAINNRIQDIRTKCGFGALKVDNELSKLSSNHLNYMTVVAKDSKSQFASHDEAPANISMLTGIGNPFYSGYGVSNRVNYKTSNNQALAINYPFQSIGENISLIGEVSQKALQNNSFDATSSMSSINKLLAAPYHLRSLVSPLFTDIGTATTMVEYMDNNLYYYLKYANISLGTKQGTAIAYPSKLVTFPCNGVVDTETSLTNESPNPFGEQRDLASNPIGQPLYFYAPKKEIATYSISLNLNGTPLELIALNKANDVNKILQANELVMMPNKPLEKATTYIVKYNIQFTDNTTEIGEYSFKTKS